LLAFLTRPHQLKRFGVITVGQKRAGTKMSSRRIPDTCATHIRTQLNPACEPTVARGSAFDVGPVLAMNRSETVKHYIDDCRRPLTRQPRKSAGRKIVMTLRIAMVVITLLLLAGYQQVKPQSNNGSNNYNELVDKTGNIRKPADFRDLYQALGVYTPVDLNGDTEMHYTYASPGTAEYYRRTGKFADDIGLRKRKCGSS
jgi:hypothetical protein